MPYPFAVIEGRPYTTPRGAYEHAKRLDWISPGGAVLSTDATMRRLARNYRASVLVEDDGSVVTYSAGGGKVRQRIAEAGSDEAVWLAGRLRDALRG